MNQSIDAEAGQAIYTPFVLKIYDLWVLGFSNRFLWQSPSHNQLNQFNKLTSPNHLDVGVGTGFYLDKCVFKSKPRLALMDLNPNSLATAAKRTKRYNPEQIHCNVLEPIPYDGPAFDSISINYLLHCLPGTMTDKSILLDHLTPLLNPGGVLFGATILADLPRNKLANKVMSIYNQKGIFSNQQDTLASLKEALSKRFTKYDVITIGSVALFSAYKE